MKCGYCNGTGEHINDANRMTTCEFCGGTGEIEATNEEWFCLLSVEDKAMALEEAIRNKMLEPKPFCHEVANNEYWLKWLKEKHE